MVEVEEPDEKSHPLLASSSSRSGDFTRTGTLWTAVAHIITGVIGSGVLSLAWSVAQLGWIAGPLAMVVFGMITVVSSNLLCDCYRYPDAEKGHIRNRSYAEAANSYLGKTSMWVVGIFVQESYYGYGIAYTITSAICMRAILKSNCYHEKGHDAPCNYDDTSFMLLFGAVQLVFSQIPDFHSMKWLSVIAAIMSFAYSTVGLSLGLARVVESGEVRGEIGGVPTSSLASKVWLSGQALGDIAFAFSFNIILLQIQDTLRAPPPENRTMKKASMVATLITGVFFLLSGCFGYAAFGDLAPGNILTGFGFYEPYWLIDIANAFVVIHLVGGYQIFSQPLFADFERYVEKRHPDNGFIINEYVMKLPLLPPLRLNLLRLCFRTAYVASTTVLGISFPYFNEVLGVLGALNFWPLAIYFPVEMYLSQNKIRAWTGIWVSLQAFRIFCLLCTIVALIGSVQGLLSRKLS
ncbi:hypothetical protein M569_03688 [Genlisea aurea]|uniref:Amino acid transporter transmembrane domain-containing protein n=1 Tax=Genlisea aurea TaxID=192259 RepID=S8E5J8_9LAMI|nr:hypothetical protein M569_03688 [Genlisea aurea]